MTRFVTHPYAILTIVALFWGGNAIAGKLAVGHVSPMLLTLLRWTFACLIMTPLAFQDVRREWPTIKRHLPFLFLLGAVGFTFFNAIFYLAMNYTSAINATIEQSAMPLVVFAANYVLFRTGVTVFQLLGFTLTLIGVLITAAHGELATLLALDLNRGDAMIIVAVLIYGGYTVALRFKPDINWRSTIYVLSLAALAASIPLAAAEWAMGYGQAPDLQGLSAALYTAIFPGLVAQILYIRGVTMIGPNRANLFINLVPIFGAMLAVGIVGEELHPYHLAALAFVLAGITLAELGAPRGTRPVERKPAPR
ncbi:EamA family transporter [Aurantimonas aggregata]|uniref:EamA family transporter n=1 Tax=Aurantimonas aggregata TaxID=2047720 RepID=A0A6L9MI34_9HYPH|nr:DMT family transporter [Aurantimonas aggregata]NDV87222.1 EamA family transporter [Aurantimonas aggregata]